MPICTNKLNNGPASADQTFLQPAKAAAMCKACHDHAHPPPPIPSFLLAQNLFSKQIAPTDNMRQESEDTKKHHWWLKG